jgi:hypothetical protein
MLFIARKKGDPMFISCGEKGCSANWTLPDEQVQAAIDRGEIVVRTTPQAGYSTLETVGVCEKCQAKYRKAARSKRGKRDVDAEHRELMALIYRTIEAHPEWSRKRCIKAAVEFVNSAAEERDPAFRAFLLEREDH